jgi:hypothetical protein
MPATIDATMPQLTATQQQAHNLIQQANQLATAGDTEQAIDDFSTAKPR